MNRKKKFAGSPTRRTENKFLVNSFMNFSLTEAYNTARTNIMFSLATKKKKTVALTSYSPADGKSSTVANLALTFAKTQAKVLLIDADMRKPSIQTLLKIKNSHGLSTLISGLCNVESALNRDVEENLDVICAGPIPPNPAELLASPYMAELMTDFQNEYDFIFIDTPPISLVSDSLLLNNLISGVVFVVRENSTRHPEIRDAIESIKLANGKILGFLKVSCKVKKRGYGVKKYGYYKYGDYYGYYNDKSSEKKDSHKSERKSKHPEKTKDDSVIADVGKSDNSEKENLAETADKRTASKSKKKSKSAQTREKKETQESKDSKGQEKNENSKSNNVFTSSDLDDILSSVSADIDKYKGYLNKKK